MTRTKSQYIRRAFNQYQASDKYNLSDCYVKPSDEKHVAFDYCLNLKHKYNGENGKIISYNIYAFSYGFVGKINNRPAFIYITKKHDRYIFMEELQNEN